jgi:hypothetical protein
MCQVLIIQLVICLWMMAKKQKHTSNGVIKRLLSQVACLIWRIENLVVEDGEIEGKAQTDGVCWGEVSVCNFSSCLVSLKRLVGRSLTLVANSKLSEITVVVTLPVSCVNLMSSAHFRDNGHIHLVIEDLGFTTLCRRDQVLIQDLQNILTNLGQLALNLLAVFLDKGDLTIIALGLLLLLNGADDTPGGSAGANDVLVCDGKEISLFNGQLLVGGGNGLHVLDHF